MTLHDVRFTYRVNRTSLMRDVIATSAAIEVEPIAIEPLTDEERAEIEHEFAQQ